ncbi:MAG: hypothetical protein JJU40_08450 [Rhodobacteraceae bacterium]|nr:hypothetical protein [Paracoccaceae bacterium]
MSWPDRLPRRVFLAALAGVALAGCGFQPLYAPGGGAHALRGSVALDLPETRLGFETGEALEARLGMAGSGAPLTLAVVPQIAPEALELTASTMISRIRLEGSASFALRRPGEETPLLEGVVRASTAYSATASTLGTRAAERDARARLARLLAERIADRLELAAGSGALVP